MTRTRPRGNQPNRSMLILFDNGTSAPLRYALKGHVVVVEAIERGWDRLVNGELITAEAAGFELLLTTDKKCVISKI